jgi:hypothetical protein
MSSVTYQQHNLTLVDYGPSLLIPPQPPFPEGRLQVRAVKRRTQRKTHKDTDNFLSR